MRGLTLWPHFKHNQATCVSCSSGESCSWAALLTFSLFSSLLQSWQLVQFEFPESFLRRVCSVPFLICRHDGPMKRKIYIIDGCLIQLQWLQQVSMITNTLNCLPERSMSSSSLEPLSFALFFPIVSFITKWGDLKNRHKRKHEWAFGRQGSTVKLSVQQMAAEVHEQAPGASQLTVTTGAQDLHCFRPRCCVWIYIYKSKSKFIFILNVPMTHWYCWIRLLDLRLSKYQKITAGS